MPALHDCDPRRGLNLSRLWCISGCVGARPFESWRKTSTFLLGLTTVICLAGLALGTWIATGDDYTTFFDGMIGFLLLTPFMLFFGSIGIVMRYVIPRMQESWYR